MTAIYEDEDMNYYYIDPIGAAGYMIYSEDAEGETHIYMGPYKTLQNARAALKKLAEFHGWERVKSEWRP